MRLFGFILIFLLVNKAFTFHDHDEKSVNPQDFKPSSLLDKNTTDWVCHEIGPFEYIDIENLDGQETRAIHLVSDEKIQRLNSKDPYNGDDVLRAIDEKIGDQYYGFPLICKRGKEVINFIEHPYIIKKNTDGNSFTKSATGSHRMHCEVFRLKGQNYTTNFNWTWYKKAEKGIWKEIDLNNSNYLQTDGGIINLKDSRQNKLFNSTLKIRSLSMVDAGDYKCMAINKYGNHEHLFELKVLSITGLIIPFVGVFVMVILISVLVLIREKINAKNEMIEELKKGNLEFSKTANA